MNGIDAAVDDIVITAGAVNALMEALVTLVSPGDRILIPDPGWPNYQMMADVLSAADGPVPAAAGRGLPAGPGPAGRARAHVRRDRC